MSYLLQIPQSRRADYEKHAAPESISAAIRKVVEAQAEAADEYQWLSHLYGVRREQIEAGTWPDVRDRSTG